MAVDQAGMHEDVADGGPGRSKAPRGLAQSRALNTLRNSGPVVIATSVLMLMVVVPLSFLLRASFRTGPPAIPDPGYTFDNYRRAFNPRLGEAFLNSMIVAVVSTIISLFFAILFAWLVERTNVPFRNLAWSVLLLPIAVPNILFVLSWTVLLSPRTGLINVLLRDWFPFLFSGDSGPINIYGLGGIIFLDSMRGITTVFLMLVAAFRMFDPAMEEAARVSGASTLKTVLRVTLPAITPAIVAAGMYSFISSMDQFEAALAAGLPGGVFLLTTLIFFAVSLRAPVDYGLGAVYSIGFMALMIVLVILYRWIVRNSERFSTVTGKGYRPSRLDLGKWRWPAFGLIAALGLVLIALPMWVMAWLSLRPLHSRIMLGSGVPLTLENYRMLMTRGTLSGIVRNTVIMTIGTATLTMFLCFIVSWVIVRGKSRRMSGFVDGLTFLPYAFPGLTIAIAFVFVFLSDPMRQTRLYGTVTILILALTTQYIAFGTRLMNGAVIQIKAELEEASRISGARQMATLMRITMPLLLPAFIAGWVWVAANAMRTFSVPAILSSRHNQVFASEIWELWETGRFTLAAATGTILVIILLPLAVILRRLMTRTSGLA